MCQIFKYVCVWGHVPNMKTNLKSVLGADVCKNLKFGIHVRQLLNLQVCSKCAQGSKLQVWANIQYMF